MVDEHLVRIDGRETSGAEWLTVVSPFDGRELVRVPRGGSGEVDRAVASAVRRLDEPLEPWQRADILDRAAIQVRSHRDELAGIVCDESAKPISTARSEVDRAVLTLSTSAGEARRLGGEVVPISGVEPGAGKFAVTLRVPRGVVGAITPFNFPINLVAHKIGPAIAAGCPIVVKPASQTPTAALRLQQILEDECGLPAGWLTVVTGTGREVGEPLVAHPDVAMVSFTGSAEVGWRIRADVPKKEVALELGNNSPLIIDASSDWEAAIPKIAIAAFSHAGQSCISTQRIYVHDSVADAFTDGLIEAVGSLRVGDPRRDDVDLSALITPSDTERVLEWIGDAVTAGASVAIGGSAEGTCLLPTVLTGVTPDMAVSRQEVFGPVVGVTRVSDVEEALDLANDTEFGLHASIYTTDLATALRSAARLRFGGVLVNEVPTFRSDPMPYGGIGDSGNTTEGPRWAVRAMTYERLVVVAP